VLCKGFVSEENHAVQNENDADNLAAQARNVVDHEKPIGFVNRPADGLVTSAKLFEVAAKLAAITDTLAQLFTQLVELIIQQTHNYIAHCLRKR